MKKRRYDAEELLRLAHKVYHYRRDILTDYQLEELLKAVKNLENALQSGMEEGEEITRTTGILDKILRNSGGAFYPRKFWAENTEVFLVAAILAIGIRTFFLQPFKIPTNSMYPTYNGMTYEVYQSAAEQPGFAKRSFRKLSLWAAHYDLTASATGNLVAPLQPVARFGASGRVNGYILRFKKIRGRKYFFFPAYYKEYTFWLDDVPTKMRVPLDFKFEKVFMEALFPDKTSLSQVCNEIGVRFDSVSPVLDTGKRFEKSDTILSFDILTGDALFVDRFSYNFVRPKVGDPFVFRTGKIPGITRRNGGIPDDKYYIKRLVGKEEDTLEIRRPVLYRNGKPIEGAKAFVFNAERTGDYEGYTYMDRLSLGSRTIIPDGHFFAMGDNSDESSDSRRWGFVPEKEVVGKAIVIYYPFSRRWGLAK